MSCIFGTFHHRCELIGIHFDVYYSVCSNGDYDLEIFTYFPHDWSVEGWKIEYFSNSSVKGIYTSMQLTFVNTMLPDQKLIGVSVVRTIHRFGLSANQLLLFSN